MKVKAGGLKLAASPFILITYNLSIWFCERHHCKPTGITSVKLHHYLLQQPVPSDMFEGFEAIHSCIKQAYQLVLIESFSLLQAIFVVF